MQRVRSSISSVTAYILLKIFSILPIQKKIIFSSFDGKNYGDNPKALYEALRKKYGEDYKYIWMMYDSSILIEGAKVVRAYSIASIFHFATARLWIHNSRQRSWLRKRKGQFYIQTWHGNIALKQIERDVEEKLPSLYIKQAKNDSKMADLFLAGSLWNEKNYRDSFWYSGEILRSGLPRSDIFFQESDLNNKKINFYYDLKENIKVILYCPTFRNDGSLDNYLKDYQKIVNNLEQTTNEEWAILVRLHPNIQKLQQNIIYSDKILDGSKIADINELLIRSDIVITDYSSVMFDALLIGKQVFIYANDLESYSEEREQYFEVGSLPFPISCTEEQLLFQLVNIDYALEYEKIGKKFISDHKFYDNGQACQKVLDRLEKVL